MDDDSFCAELARIIEKAAEEHSPLMAVARSRRDRPALHSLARGLAHLLGGEIIRSAYTPNSELSLFEIRREGLAVILLIVKSEEENIVVVEQTTDAEIAEIESNIYSSNINDIYIRLVSDIF